MLCIFFTAFQITKEDRYFSVSFLTPNIPVTIYWLSIENNLRMSSNSPYSYDSQDFYTCIQQTLGFYLFVIKFRWILITYLHVIQISSSSLSLYAGAYVSFLIEINVYFLRYHTFVQWSQLSDGFKKSYDFVTDPAFFLLLKNMGFMLFQDSHIISKVWSHMCLKINTCKYFIFR